MGLWSLRLYTPKILPQKNAILQMPRLYHESIDLLQCRAKLVGCEKLSTTSQKEMEYA